MTLFQIMEPDEQPVSPPTGANFEEIITAVRNRGYTPGAIVKGLLGPIPLTVLNYSSDRVTASLQSLLARRSFDSIQIESSHLFSYLEVFRAVSSKPSILLDWHNIESELMLRYAAETTNLPKKIVARRTARLLQHIENRLVAGCDFHTVVSELDQAKLLAHDASAQVSILPNGVDTRSFASSETSYNTGTLLFVGSMDYHANVDAVTWFTRQVWPSMASRYPALQFTIVGRSPSPAVQALQSERVQVTGTVDDVRPFYAKARAVIVPLRVGGGTRLKILEAMAMGVPIISTRIGAEGIAASDGKDILLADSEPEMLAALDRLSTDPALRQSLTEAGRCLAERYDWSHIGNQLFNIHRELVNDRVLS